MNSEVDDGQPKLLYLKSRLHFAVILTFNQECKQIAQRNNKVPCLSEQMAIL